MEGLESTSISRLHRTWKNIPKRSKEQFNTIQSLVSCNCQFTSFYSSFISFSFFGLIIANSNFAKLKKVIHDCQGPLVPYIPIYLKELRAIDDCYPEFSDSGLINWEKKRYQGLF
jgi:hypothetical protein